MHLGSFDDEPTSVALMDDFLEQNGYEFCFDGVEVRSIVAVGMIECKTQKKAFLHGYDAMLERVNPSAIIILGTPFSEMRGNIAPVEYQFNGKGGY